MPKALSKCPVCSGSLRVTELACGSCGTLVRNAFDACRYCGLAPDEATFVDVFLRNRGNLSSAGAELGLSFPTVSRRLDSVLETLGMRQSPTRSGSKDAGRRHIIEMLDRGEITAEDATRRIREL